MRPGEIRIDGLGKRYRIRSGVDDEETDPEGDPEEQEEGGASRLMSLFRGRKSEFWALRNISCHIRPGERLAIVGANGSGKSTLLQILSRALPPSEGSVTGAGLVVPFGALRKPISSQVSGVENLRILARLLGIPLPHLEARLSDIIAFSGLGRLAHEQVSRFSDSSYARLAMAMGLFVDADVYLVDGGLWVGDDLYSNKFEEKLIEVLRRDITLIYASNNLSAVRAYSDRALWLSQGRLAADGEVNPVVQRFLAANDDTVDFAELAKGEGVSPDPEPSDAKPRRRVAFTSVADENNLVQVPEWVAAATQAERAWQQVLAQWRTKNPSELVRCQIVAESRALAAIQTMRCVNSIGHPFRRCLPGEPLFVELSVETVIPSVTVSVRLEMDSPPTLIFVAEPIVPLVANVVGTYLFRVEVPSCLMAHTSESIAVMLHARVLVTTQDGNRREMSKATITYDLRGDNRALFDRQRQADGHPATSIIEPAPPSIKDEDEIDRSARPVRSSAPMSRWEVLNRRPALRPSLDWTIFRVDQPLI